MYCPVLLCPALYCCPCLLQLLDRDLEEAEEQHQAALRSHLMVLDSLLDLQVRPMRSVCVRQRDVGCLG